MIAGLLLTLVAQNMDSTNDYPPQKSLSKGSNKEVSWQESALQRRVEGGIKWNVPLLHSVPYPSWESNKF